jgi:hypothetical protein
LTCPICEKRKAKRFCPARSDTICSQCCGTEREVTIDCPSDCSHLIASRQYDLERKEIDWSKSPFPETRFKRSAVGELAGLIDALARSICEYADEHRFVIDIDALASIESLAETYRTLSSGLYYERPPDYAYQRELYGELKEAVEEYGKAESQRLGVANVRPADVRDALVFLAQLCFAHSNGRPKGRAFLDLLRSNFKSEQMADRASNLVVLA